MANGGCGVDAVALLDWWVFVSGKIADERGIAYTKSFDFERLFGLGEVFVGRGFWSGFVLGILVTRSTTVRQTD